MSNALRWVWAEPRVPHAPARVWRDWLVVAALVLASLVEQAVRSNMPWRGVAVAEVAVLAFVLMRRRTNPLAMVVVAFGTVIVIDVLSIAVGTDGSVSPFSMAFLLLLPYALFRWGAGRDVVIGLPAMLLAAVVGLIRDWSSVADSIIGFIILLMPMVLGASVRFWTTSREREIDQVRLREREQLARELHDTVAHHVSAMVIRAQAGRVVATTRPEAAIEALEIIEAEGSRTLTEMRSMVGALRESDEADLSPQSGIADIEHLARSVGDELTIEVHLPREVEGIAPAVGSAVYRIAQESITNAKRHARNATHIVVRVATDVDTVRLSVSDDGDMVNATRSPDGYGVIGMTERAALLGGSLTVGPNADRGWTVKAVLPRRGADA